MVHHEDSKSMLDVIYPGNIIYLLETRVNRGPFRGGGTTGLTFELFLLSIFNDKNAVVLLAKSGGRG